MEPDVLNRLRRVAARQTLTLTHYGRKSGKSYEVTIWFVLDDEKFYIGTANVNRQWVRKCAEDTAGQTVNRRGDVRRRNYREGDTPVLAFSGSDSNSISSDLRSPDCRCNTGRESLYASV